MNMYILAEPAFHDSSWYNEILSGIKSAKNARRLALSHGNVSPEFIARVKNDSGVLLVLGASYEWISSALDAVFKSGLYPIIIGTVIDENSPPHCLMAQDYTQSAFGVYRQLESLGCKKIAFFGHNRGSAADRMKLGGVRLAARSDENDIFINRGNIEKLCEELAAKADEYDGIICANDYVGAALVKHLRELYGGKPFPHRIASFGNTLLLKRLCPSVISATLDFALAGKKAAELYPFVCNNKDCLSMRITIKSNFASSLPVSDLASNAKDGFFGDAKINGIMRFERVLENAEYDDIKILESLACGNTLEHTSELCNMGVSGIKYRLKRLKTVGEYKSNSELLEAFADFQKWG